VQEIGELVRGLDITPTFNKKYYFVTRDGQKTYEGSRVYFFERHDGAAPSNWLVHDQHAGLSLGSWFGMRGSVLCRVTSDDSNANVSIFIALGIIAGISVVIAVVAVTVCICVCIKRRNARTAPEVESDNTIVAKAIENTGTNTNSIDNLPVAIGLPVAPEQDIDAIPVAVTQIV